MSSSYFTDDDRRVVEDCLKNKASGDTLSVPALLCYLDRPEFRLDAAVPATPYRTVKVDIPSKSTLKAVGLEDIADKLDAGKAPLTQVEAEQLVDAVLIINSNAALYAGAVFRQPSTFAIRGPVQAGPYDALTARWCEKNFIGLRQADTQYEKIIVPIVNVAQGVYALIEMIYHPASIEGLDVEIVAHVLAKELDLSAHRQSLKALSGVVDAVQRHLFTHSSDQLRGNYVLANGTSFSEVESITWLCKMIQWSMGTMGITQKPLIAGELNRPIPLADAWTEIKASLFQRALVITTATKIGASWPASRSEMLTDYDVPVLRLVSNEFLQQSSAFGVIKSIPPPFVSSSSSAVRAEVADKDVALVALERFIVDRLLGASGKITKPPKEVAESIWSGSEWPNDLLNRFKKVAAADRQSWPFDRPLISFFEKDLLSPSTIYFTGLFEVRARSSKASNYVHELREIYAGGLKLIGANPENSTDLFGLLKAYNSHCKALYEPFATSTEERFNDVVIPDALRAVVAQLDAFGRHLVKIDSTAALDQADELAAEFLKSQLLPDTNLYGDVSVEDYSIQLRVAYSRVLDPSVPSPDFSKVRLDKKKKSHQTAAEKKSKSQPATKSLIDELCGADDDVASVSGPLDFLKWFSTPAEKDTEAERRLAVAMSYGQERVDQEEFARAAFDGDSFSSVGTLMFNRPHIEPTSIRLNIQRDLIREGFFETVGFAYFAGTLLYYLSSDEAFYSDPANLELMTSLFPEAKTDRDLLHRSRALAKVLMEGSTVTRDFPWTPERRKNIEALLSVTPLEAISDADPATKDINRWLKKVVVDETYASDNRIHAIFFTVIRDIHNKLVRTYYGKIADFFEEVASKDVDDDHGSYGRGHLASQARLFVNLSTRNSELATALLTSSAAGGGAALMIAEYLPRMLLINTIDAMLAISRSLQLFTETNSTFVDRSLSSNVTESFSMTGIEETAPSGFGSSLISLLKRFRLHDDLDDDLLLSRELFTGSKDRFERLVLLSIDQTFAPVPPRRAVADLVIRNDLKSLQRFLDLSDGGMFQAVSSANDAFLKSTRMSITTFNKEFNGPLIPYVAGAFDQLLDVHLSSESAPVTTKSDVDISRAFSDVVATRLHYAELVLKSVIAEAQGTPGGDASRISQLQLYASHVYVMIVDPRTERIYWAGLGDASPSIAFFTQRSLLSRRQRLERMLDYTSKLLEATMTPDKQRELESYITRIGQLMKTEESVDLFISGAEFNKRLASFQQRLGDLRAQLDLAGSDTQKDGIRDRIRKTRNAIMYFEMLQLTPALNEGNKRAAIDRLISSSPTLQRLLDAWRSDWNSFSQRMSLISFFNFLVPEKEQMVKRMVTSISANVTPLLSNPKATTQQFKDAVKRVYSDSVGVTFLTPTLISAAQNPTDLIVALAESISLGDGTTIKDLVDSQISSVPMLMKFIDATRTAFDSAANSADELGVESLLLFLQLIGSNWAIAELEIPPNFKILIESWRRRRAAASDALRRFIVANGTKTPVFIALLGNVSPALDQEAQGSTHRALATLALSQISADTKVLIVSKDKEGRLQLKRAEITAAEAYSLYNASVVDPDEFFGRSTNTFRICRFPAALIGSLDKYAQSKKVVDGLCVEGLKEPLIFAPPDLDQLAYELDHFVQTNTFLPSQQSSSGSNTAGAESGVDVEVYPIDIKERPISSQNYLDFRMTSHLGNSLSADWPIINPFAAALEIREDNLDKALAAIIDSEPPAASPMEMIKHVTEQICAEKGNSDYLGAKLLGVLPSLRMFGGFFVKDTVQIPADDFVGHLFDSGVPMVVARIIQRYYEDVWSKSAYGPVLGNFVLQNAMAYGIVELDKGIDSLVFLSGMGREASLLYSGLLNQTFTDSVLIRQFKRRLSEVGDAGAAITRTPETIPRFTLPLFDVSIGVYQEGKLHELVRPVQAPTLPARLGVVQFGNFVKRIHYSLYPVLPRDYYRQGTIDVDGIISRVLAETSLRGLADFVGVIARINEEITDAYSNVPDLSSEGALEKEIVTRAQTVLKARNDLVLFSQFVFEKSKSTVDSPFFTDYPYGAESAQRSRLDGRHIQVNVVPISSSTGTALDARNINEVKSRIISLYLMLVSALDVGDKRQSIFKPTADGIESLLIEQSFIPPKMSQSQMF